MILPYLRNDFLLILRVLFRRKTWYLINFGSIGDNLMAFGVLKAFMEESGTKPIVVLKKNVFKSEIDLGISYNRFHFTYKFLRKINILFPKPVILKYNLKTVSKNVHLSQEMAKVLNFKYLQKSFKPWMPNPSRPKNIEGIEGKYIVIQSSSKTTFTPNKNWSPGKMNALAKMLKADYKIIQIGLDDDEDINADIDFRGKLNILESAWIIQKSILFIGLEGALMHISAYLNSPAIIIYGGYISPEMTSYSNVIPIYTHIECSPCLLQEACPYELKCMSSISVEQVLKIARKKLAL